MRQLVEVQNPIWQDVETKNRILARFVYDDESSVVMSVPVDPDNHDYQDFLRFSSIETVEEHTQIVRDKMAEDREKSVAQNTERSDQKKANTLFNAKIEAFEHPLVQNASTEWKAKIRKATTTVEIVAIVAALIIKDIEQQENGTNPV